MWINVTLLAMVSSEIILKRMGESIIWIYWKWIIWQIKNKANQINLTASLMGYLVHVFYDLIAQFWPTDQKCYHDDVIKWKYFPRYWPFVQGIHRSPVNSHHKGQWHGALVFSLISAWINGWVNNREAGDLGRRRAHYDVTVMVIYDWQWYIRARLWLLWKIVTLCE